MVTRNAVMNELSLFTGAGGGVLGTHGLLNWRCLAYVEWEEYAQKVIRARIEDGILDEAPIYTDVREFVESGAARQYRGHIDVVSGGFPCQPFSVAGKREGDKDERDMWPATLGVIREVRPRFCFLENVRGLLSFNDGAYFRRILGQLSEAGYDARWCVLSARDCGAPHKRERLWIVANTDCEYSSAERGRDSCDAAEGGRWHTYGSRCGSDDRGVVASEADEFVANAKGQRYGNCGECGSLPEKDEHQKRLLERGSLCGESFIPSCQPENVADTRREHGESRNATGMEAEEGIRASCLIQDKSGRSRPWEADPAEGSTEPGLGRVADGVAHRVDRLKAIGNGQVPLVAATAWEILNGSR